MISKPKFYFFFICIFFCAFESRSDSNIYYNLIDSADNYIKKELWQNAESTLISALREEPANFNNAMVFSNLGIVRTNLGRYDEALEAFGLGLNISPGSTVLLNNRAKTLMITEDFLGALEDLNQSLKIDSIQEWPLSMKGMILINSNNLNDAEVTLKSLIRNFPENARAYFGLGLIEEKNGNFKEAVRYYEKSLSIEEDEDIYPFLILLMVQDNLYSEAAEIIRKCIGNYPENPIFYLLRGYLSRLNYRYDEAEADRQLAISKGADPQLVDNYLPKGRR